MKQRLEATHFIEILECDPGDLNSLCSTPCHPKCYHITDLFRHLGLTIKSKMKTKQVWKIKYK